jgi:hypothetical protein
VPPLRFFGFLAVLAALPSGTSQAHNGKLDGNGCHYETATGRYHCHRAVKPNKDVKAPAKKSRENVCHDATSSNYSTIKYFIGYTSMQACLTSGGRQAR